jgi:hypothetical protein
MIVTSELDIIVISLIYITCEYCCTLNISAVVAYLDQEVRVLLPCHKQDGVAREVS